MVLAIVDAHPLLAGVPDYIDTLNVELKIGGKREISRFLDRMGVGCVFRIADEATHETPTKCLDGIEYVLLSSGSWSLWVQVADMYAIKARMNARIGYTFGDFNLLAHTLLGILLAAGVKRLHAVAHSVLGTHNLFGLIDSMLLPECVIGGEVCYVVAQGASPTSPPPRAEPDDDTDEEDDDDDEGDASSHADDVE